MNQDQLKEVLQAAAARHVRSAKSPFPGFAAVALDTDVRLEPWRATVHAGAYFLEDTTAVEAADGPDLILYVASAAEVPDPAELADVADGGKVPEVKMELAPLRVSTRVKPFGLLEVAGWAAVADLREEGKDDMASEVLDALYGGEVARAAGFGRVDEDPQGLPKQNTEPVRHFIQLTSKVSNPKFWQGMEKVGGKKLDISGQNEPPAYVIVQMLSDDDGGLGPYQGTEEATTCAITSLAYAGRWDFTTADVARLSYSVANPSKSQIQATEDDINRMAVRRTSVDFTEEARRRGLTEATNGDVSKYVITDQMLSIKQIDMEFANGRTGRGWHLKEYPMLMQHDMAVGAFSAVPTRVLEAADGISSTRLNIIIRSYLLRRVVRMKNRKSGGRTSKRIRYAAVMERAGLENDAKGKNKARIKKAVRGYLDAWTSTGFIKGWGEYKTDGEKGATGIELKF